MSDIVDSTQPADNVLVTTLTGTIRETRAAINLLNAALIAIGAAPVTGSVTTTQKISASGYNVLPTDLFLICDCTANDVTLTLPDINTLIAGSLFWIKKIDATANLIKLRPYNFGVTIEGSIEYDLTLYNESVMIQFDGVNFIRFN